MKDLQFTNYLFQKDMKNKYEELSYSIGPVYQYNEETDKNDIEVPEVFCNIKFSDMLQEIRLLASKELIEGFVKDFAEQFTSYKKSDIIDLSGLEDLCNSLGITITLDNVNLIETISEKTTPEEFAKDIKKSMSSLDLERFIEELRK